jgi:hypothetical protein
LVVHFFVNDGSNFKKEGATRVMLTSNLSFLYQWDWVFGSSRALQEAKIHMSNEYAYTIKKVHLVSIRIEIIATKNCNVQTCNKKLRHITKKK